MMRRLNGSGSTQIICLNLREFGQVIVRDHLWDTPDQIKIELVNHLSGKRIRVLYEYFDKNDIFGILW
jgi:hypothetical protein